MEHEAEKRRPLVVASLNIQLDHHLAVLPGLLSQLGLDVLLAQEVRQTDLSLLQDAMEMESAHFSPMGVLTRTTGENKPFGVAIFTKKPSQLLRDVAYGPFNTDFPEYWKSRGGQSPQCKLLVARYYHQANWYHLGTTHGPWSPAGQVTPSQERVVQELVKEATSLNHLLLSGDLNIGRDKEVFRLLTDHFRDCLPPEITTSIDPLLHRAGALQTVVDCLLATPEYTVDCVRLKTGFSDHQLVIADVQ